MSKKHFSPSVIFYLYSFKTCSSAATLISLLVSDVNPDFHTFSVLDLSLSYPYRSAKLSIPLFIFLSIIVPVLVITATTLLTPSPRLLEPRNPTTSQVRTQKFQYLNSALLGLGVSLATSTVIVTGVKNLAGKPRPNFLSTCDPDLTNIEKFTSGAFDAGFNRLWAMVDVEVCQQTAKGAVRDGFRSFPSGFATSKLFPFELTVCLKLIVNRSCVCRLVVPVALSLQRLRGCLPVFVSPTKPTANTRTWPWR